jgi:hypothetical protein
MGNDNLVVSHKLCGFEGRVGGRVVVMKGRVVVAPKFWYFSSHIFSEVSQAYLVVMYVISDTAYTLLVGWLSD